MKEITITQSFTAAELSNGSLYTLLYSRLGKVLMFAYSFITLNLVLQVINPYGLFGDGIEADYTPFIAVTLVPLLFIFTIKRQAGKALIKKGRYYKDISFTITPDHVKTDGEGYSNTYRWEEIVKVKEVKNWYFIFINKQQALLLKKSNMDPWQEEELKEVLKIVRNKTKVSLK